MATPWSVRPRYFFSDAFCTRSSKAIPRSHRPGFFNTSGHTTVCQTKVFFFDILDLDVNDHTTVSQTGPVVWSLTSYVEKVTRKNPVCETEVWSLADRVKNLNAGIPRPSKLPVTDGGRMPVLKLLPSGSLQIRWCGTERGEFSFLTSDADIKKKKAEFVPFCFHVIVFAAIRKANILRPASVVHQ